MWRRNAFVLVLVAVSIQTSPGQDLTRDSLVASQDWARCDLVLGRITAVHIRGGQSRCAKTSGDVDEIRESLSVTGDGEMPAIRYELVDARQTLTIDVVNRNHVSIRRQPSENSELAPVEFFQPSRGQVVLAIGTGERRRECVADSVWHLLLAERELCRVHLIPILERLRPDWQLLEMAQQVETDLFRRARAGSMVTRQQSLKLVADLDAPQFSRRRAADRELRKLGVAVLTWLDDLDPAAMSREQRQRVQRIQNDLTVLTEDTAPRVSSWLLEDKVVWLAMLSHREAAKRQAAASHLAGTYPEVVHFDPSANESDRQAQIKRLRLRLSRR